MHEGDSVQSEPGTTALSRLVLSFVAMLGTWLLYCILHLLRALAIHSMFDVVGLTLWSGMLAGVTYVVFVVPVTALFPRRLQLRFWYLLFLLSMGWVCLVFRGFFRQWPWASSSWILLYWVFGFAVCAFSIYMLLLWRGGRILAGRKARPALDSLSIS